MYLRHSDNVYGVLIDFDLASFLMDMDKSPASKFRTGTKPYMSFDLLTSRYAKTDKGHPYRYDLESLFYIVLILSCHYTGPNTLTSRLHFSEWFDRADQDVANKKLLFLQDTEEPPVQEFFSGFSDWIRSIRLMLGMGYNNRLFLGMSEKSWPSLPSEMATYDFETLGGNITYMKMMEVMSTFEGEGLLFRSGSSEE
ncbi:hypothetical protein D9757_007828 [Collybiopsis confluens]|uniref:Fungal-type protein kinase domain-containing protein n=1 Tax=Collybiopsis confluens TaxID=2823264 RepID=A0A8H5H0A2_9AGAR|nr:hypothetical protein D9757_011821 [Collybiopsis confluens]KAF5387452.1 hypothetical protein D9757_007828 [Collybiopsis confluens]